MGSLCKELGRLWDTSLLPHTAGTAAAAGQSEPLQASHASRPAGLTPRKREKSTFTTVRECYTCREQCLCRLSGQVLGGRQPCTRPKLQPLSVTRRPGSASWAGGGGSACCYIESPLPTGLHSLTQSCSWRCLDLW